MQCAEGRGPDVRAALASVRQTPIEALHVPELDAGFHLLYRLKLEEARSHFEAKRSWDCRPWRSTLSESARSVSRRQPCKTDSCGEATVTSAQFQSVLVIADPALEGLMELLAQNDRWKIHVSSTMADAFAELSRRTYQVLITGPNPAASEDLEFFKKVRKTDPKIKLIALSFEGEKRDVIEAIQESAFSYFTAPFSAESIVAMVATALNAEDWKDGIELVSNLPSWVTLRVSSSRVTAERVAQFMRELESDLPEEDREAIGIAFREMLLNAMEHGGLFDPASKVDLSYVRTRRMILYQLYDPGPGFSIDRLPQAATSNPMDQPFGHLAYRTEHGLRPGGFGILMTRELVDDLLYNEKGNGVLLIKYVSPDARDQHQVEPSLP